MDDSSTKINPYIKEGAELPMTGGIGTIIFCALGALLTAGALMGGHILRRKRERRYR